MKKLSHIKQISVSEFKAKALRLIDETWKKGSEFVITKRGASVARVIPIKKRSGTRFGSLRGLAEIHGDIVHFDTSEDWEVLKE